MESIRYAKGTSRSLGEPKSQSTQEHRQEIRRLKRKIRSPTGRLAARVLCETDWPCGRSVP